MSKPNNHNTIYDNLPMKCATYIESQDVVGLITKGVEGYVPMIDADKQFVESFNLENGVDSAIKSAMEIGSILGWDAPEIDPALHRKTS